MIIKHSINFDRDLRRLARAVQADPENPNLITALYNARARIEGEDVLRELLNDRHHWRGARPELHERVLELVAADIAPAFDFVEIKDYRCAGISHPIASFSHLRSGILLQLLPGGEYYMGSVEGFETEKPRHKVRVRPFLLGRFLLQQQEWDIFGGADNRRWQGPSLPIEGVSWHAAQQWLSDVGSGLRLPSEAEWEYACRAGSNTTYYWGETMDRSYCWYWNNAGQRSQPVSLHAANTNAFGLVDMLGNVEEWCEDDYSRSYRRGPKDQEPMKVGGSGRVERGGSWNSGPATIRVARRGWLRPEWRSFDLGLRVARSLS